MTRGSVSEQEYFSMGPNPNLVSLIIIIVIFKLFNCGFNICFATVNCRGDYLIIIYIVTRAVLYTVFDFLGHFSRYKSSWFKELRLSSSLL